MDRPRREIRSSPFRKAPYLEPEEIGARMLTAAGQNVFATTVPYRRIRKG